MQTGEWEEVEGREQKGSCNRTCPPGDVCPTGILWSPLCVRLCVCRSRRCPYELSHSLFMTAPCWQLHTHKTTCSQHWAFLFNHHRHSPKTFVHTHPKPETKWKSHTRCSPFSLSKQLMNVYMLQLTFHTSYYLLTFFFSIFFFTKYIIISVSILLLLCWLSTWQYKRFSFG